MAQAEKSNLLPWLKEVRKDKRIVRLNAFFASPWGIALFAALTLLSFLFSMELLLYAFIILYALYLCLFGEDFLTIVPLFFFCYVSASQANNPGRADGSIFFGTNGIIILGFAFIAVVAVFLRIGLDKDMGFKRLFTTKRSLLWGFLALGVAYLLSGIGNFNYPQVAGKNLLFATLQFLALFLLYFILTGTVDLSKKDKDYLPWSVLFMGLLVAGELLVVLLTGDVIVDGTINRRNIYVGWGTYNNMGAMIALAIPFAFYLAAVKKHGYLFLPVATLLLVAVFFTCSRSSSLFATLAFACCFIVTAIKGTNKKGFWIATGALVVAAIAVGLIFYEQVSALFLKIPSIFNDGTQDFQGELAGTSNQFGGILGFFNDSYRFETYGEGLKVFLQNPIFGESFYQSGYVPASFATLEQFNGFFPPRWHNTFVQILASCGTVGMLAYLFHRVQTAIVFLKKPTLYKSFVGIGVLLLLLMSMLDCHLFNIGPAFFYSICLAFAEKTEEEKGIGGKTLLPRR